MSAPPAPCLAAPPRWLTPVLLAVAALVYLPTLRGGFLGDDFVYIARFRELPWSGWPALFLRDWSGGVWGEPLRELRPFAALAFMSDAKLFGGWAPGYRLTNLALHLIATAAVVRLAWRYVLVAAGPTGATAAAATAGLAFALHPAHAEAVVWITGRVDLIATAAALIFWLGAESYADHGSCRCAGIAAGGFFVGIFAKEFVMFAPFLLLLRWTLLSFRAPREVWLRRARIFAIILLILAGYATARRMAFGSDGIGHNLWTDVPAWNRQAAHFGWFLPLLPPTGRLEWARPPSIAVLHAVWLGLAALTAGGLIFALRRGARLAAAALFFGGVWYFITVFPLTAVVYFSPRHLYFPTVGLALAAGFLAAAAGRARLIAAGAVALWFAAALGPAAIPWVRASRISASMLATLDADLQRAPAGSLALTAIPETLDSIWFGAWSSPSCYGAPFLATDLPTGRVIERPVNYIHTDTWLADRRPVESLRAAPGAVALHVTTAGDITHRIVTPPELSAAADRLEASGVNEASWDALVRSLSARP